MTARSAMVNELCRRSGGLLKLWPTYVQRFYPDLNRLGQRKLKGAARQFVPERWIASSVEANNPPPLPSGGMSMLADVRQPLSLRDAIRAAPQMLGPEIQASHGAEFRVLVKILDPGEPIVFHFHATDAQVLRLQRHFRGHRFGKDEAYYFLEASKGPAPYTHAGLHEGVTRRELIDAVRKGPEHALELSPAFYQEFETGFFLPAGVPHRPGTALTLEVQQPSDVYTLMEERSAGKTMSARQIHPGFRSLDEAFKLIDIALSQRVGRLAAHRLLPRGQRHRGGEIATIFPPEVCKKFAGKRLRVSSQMVYAQPSPLALLVWRGKGTVNGRPVRAGDEFFVVFETARAGLEITNRGETVLEVFALMPLP